ncbi:MAG: glycoside hydrolase family protein [Rikenellaceae bacterium]
MKKIVTISAVFLTLLSFSPISASAQIEYREVPTEWQHLVEGGSFIDRIMPMPKGKLSMDSWGALNVQPRYIDNGIEDNKISYWGGNIVKESDNKYHLFVSGWYENNPRGHMGWYDASYVFHATCDNSIGPFIVQDTLGHGHNTEIVKLKNGKFMVYHIGGRGGDEHTDCLRYISDNLNGPWTQEELKWNLRDRSRHDGVGGTSQGNWYHNMSFTTREDGSVVMVNRGGKIFISRDGLEEFGCISENTVYPKTAGRYEDPLIWRDNVQYNMIVNDWIGRTAFYLRSKDGVDWVADPGQAYVPGVSVHEDGRVEDWYKYERVRVLQDEWGRAEQINFAVIDTIKMDDLPNDNHSSKNIGMPLNKGLLLEVLNSEPFTRKTKEILVKIKAEKGFNPAEDLDIESLHFGASSEVNFGRGAKVLKTEKSGDDLIVVFSGENHCIAEDEFAPKLLGKDKNGEMVFGYSRLKWIDYNPAILSALKPTVSGSKMYVEIENLGVSASKSSFVTISSYNSDGVQTQVGSAVVKAIEPYGKCKVAINLDVKATELIGKPIVVKIGTGVESSSSFRVEL